MNIKKMLYAQKELDDIWMKRANLTEYPLEMTITAYRVELGELLQEWKQFKFWKMNKGEINREKMLEEWADCMHFALSLENYIKKYNCEDDGYYRYIVNHIENDVKEYFNSNNKIYDLINRCFTDFDILIENTLALGIKLGYTLDELDGAYWKKHKINWERIKNNY